ncbi:MAG: 7-cyano-7-deazaguanine synthase QueC [Bdellovibrionales bacterium]|nr:7-cyano-7-deazaguanine synthase QueC [Bdellovibrionales bacterium]
MNEPTPDVVILLSGGLDSSTLLYHLRQEGWRPAGLAIDYGQRHRRELAAARAIAGEAGIHLRVADISPLQPLLLGSALTDPTIDVPSGHYTDESMKATVVPNRNMLFLAVAASWAIAQGASAVAYAAHAGDHAIYPDCRPEFVRAMSAALGLADWRQLELATPFLDWDKGQIVRRGAELGVPFEKTWSCYRGGTAHCGTCGTCVERREAFSQAGVADPTIYELYE